MEALRLPRSTSVDVTVEDLPAEEAVVVNLTNLLTLEDYDPISGTTDIDGILTFSLPTEFVTHDGYLSCNIDDDTSTIWNDNIDVIRPYIDIVAAAERLDCTEEQAEYYERIARYIIDSKTSGFRYLRNVKSLVGMGHDYLPVDEKIWSLESVYENGELVWDTVSEDWTDIYGITSDHTAVHVVEVENMSQYRPVWRDRYALPDFPDGWDYEITGTFGFMVIPHDIKEAALLLVNDLSCGALKYFNKYIAQYKTDAFDIKYDRFKFGESTGNMIVDSLISRYETSIVPKVL